MNILLPYLWLQNGHTTIYIPVQFLPALLLDYILIQKRKKYYPIHHNKTAIVTLVRASHDTIYNRAHLTQLNTFRANIKPQF